MGVEKNDDASDLEKLREILVGHRFRDLEKKLQQLDNQLRTGFDNIKGEMNLRFKTFEDEFSSFKSTTIKSEDELRQVSSKSLQDLSNEFQRAYKQFVSNLKEEVTNLEEEKVDRSMMASMFGEITKRLKEEDGKEAGKNQ